MRPPFTALEDYVGTACAGIDDPVDRLAAMGRAYITFGVSNPEPYRIMFMTRPDITPVQFQGMDLAESPTFALLLSCVQDCIDAGRFRPEYTDAFLLSLGFWARVHGLTSLQVTKPDMPWPDDPDFVGDYAQICLRGVVRNDT